MELCDVNIWRQCLASAASVMPSGLIHAVARTGVLPLIPVLFHCMYCTVLVHPSPVEHLGCSRAWDVKSTAAANMSVHVCVDILILSGLLE